MLHFHLKKDYSSIRFSVSFRHDFGSLIDELNNFTMKTTLNHDFSDEFNALFMQNYKMINIVMCLDASTTKIFSHHNSALNNELNCIPMKNKL